MITRIQKFFTVEYKEYSHGVARMVDRKILLYTKAGNGCPPYNPPNTLDVWSRYMNMPISPKNFLESLGEIKIKDPSLEVKKRLEKNIEIQDFVMKTIEKRHKQFNYTSGIIKAGTGIGKSVIAIKIAKYFKNNTLILVTNVKLLNEMIERVEDFTGVKPAQYGGGKKEIGPITICTKKSFTLDASKICKDMKFETIIVDECHQGFSDSFRAAMNKNFENVALYGMSATPFTANLTEDHLSKYFGAIIQAKNEYKTPEIKMINYKQDYTYDSFPDLRDQLVDDEQRMEAQINELRNLFRVRRNIVVLTDRVAEGENFYNKLNNTDTSSYNLILINGTTKPEDDENSIKEAQKNGKKTILIASIQKFGTGADYPELDCVFLISSIKFESTVEQACGRIYRKHPGKLDPKIIIFNDMSLNSQRLQKIKAMYDVYGVTKDQIEFEMIDNRVSDKAKFSFSNILNNG